MQIHGNEVWADISTYVKEMSAKFITGEDSLDEWDTYVNTLYDMGLQEAIDVYQNALDAYKSKA